SSRPVMYALAPRFPSIDINATLQRARMRVQPAVALRRSARRPGGDAGGKRLHRDLSVPHDERIGDHLVDVVRGLRLPQNVGMVALDGQVIQAELRPGFPEL